LAAYASAIRELARERAIPCADVYRAWEEKVERGVDVNLMLANGLNHPTAEAHAIPAELLIELVVAADVSTAVATEGT